MKDLTTYYEQNILKLAATSFALERNATGSQLKYGGNKMSPVCDDKHDQGKKMRPAVRPNLSDDFGPQCDSWDFYKMQNYQRRFQRRLSSDHLMTAGLTEL